MAATSTHTFSKAAGAQEENSFTAQDSRRSPRAIGNARRGPSGSAPTGGIAKTDRAKGVMTVPGAFSGPPVNTPIVTDVALMGEDGMIGNRGNNWGGHQVRHVLHRDGTERVVYVGGAPEGRRRSWHLMKRAPNGDWMEESAGQTDHEVFLLRDPSTDTAHLLAFPLGVPTVYASPMFKPQTIPGWAKETYPYISAGIGADGTLIVKSYSDQLIGHQYTRDTEMQYVSGRFRNGAWAFRPPVKKYVGDRYTYDYVLPGAFGNPEEFADVGIRNLAKNVAGVPDNKDAYVWDGVRQFKTAVSSADALSYQDLIPKRTRLGKATSKATFMYAQDVFADSKGRLLSLHSVSDDGKPGVTHFTVSDAAGNRLQQTTLPIGGNIRIYEDAKHRLWLLRMLAGTGEHASALLFRLAEKDGAFSLQSSTDVSKIFPDGYSGGATIAAPRGGNPIGDTIVGSYPSDRKMYSFHIRLPD